MVRSGIRTSRRFYASARYIVGVLVLVAFRARRPKPSAPSHGSTSLGEVVIERAALARRADLLDLKGADRRRLSLVLEGRAPNVVVDPGVRGRGDRPDEDVPWDQALDLILRMNGYAMVRDGRILRIGRPEIIAR